jgi:predicted enzyme related to lactoylglutathione lyase
VTHQEETHVKLKIMNVYVDDLDKALKFYTEVLGFQKKSDFSTGGYRWLTVVSPQEPAGPELHLETTANPAAKAFQQALYGQGQPAAMFFVDDVQAEYDRMTGLGVSFKMPPTKTTGSSIAQLDDTCGNVIQLTHLNWG